MIRQFLFTGLLIVAGFAAIPSARADAAGEALVRDALNAVSSKPGWTASAKTVRSEGDKVIAEGLTIAHPASNFRLSIGNAALLGPAERANGYFAASVSVSGLDVDYDLAAMVEIDTADTVQASMEASFRSDSLEIDGLFLPGNIPSGSGPDGMFSGIIGLYGFLAEVEMASLKAPSIVLEQSVKVTGLDNDQISRTTYRDLLVSDWSGGIVARSQADGVLMEVIGGPTGDYSIGVDSVTSEHIDLAHTVHVLDPARYEGGRGDGVWKPVVKQADYRGISIKASEATASIAQFSMSGFEMRQPDKPFLSYLETLIASGVADKEPEPEMVLKMMREFLPGIFGAFRVGEVQVSELSVQPVDASKPGSMSIEKFQISNISSDGIDLFEMTGLAGKGPDVDVKLGTFRFDKIGFPKWDSLAAIAELAAEAEKNPANPEIGGDMALRVMEVYPTADHFLMSDLSGNAPGKPPFRIDTVEVQVTKRAMGFMVGGTGAVKGVMFPASYFDEGSGPNPMTLLNYERFAMDLDFVSDWDEATSNIDYTLNTQVEDMGDLLLEYHLSGLTEESMQSLFEKAFALGASGKEDDIQAIIALFEDIGFRGFVFGFTDRSIVDRAINLVASQNGTDAQTYRSQLKAALPFFLSAMPPGDFREQVIATAQATLDGGQVTTFSLKPAQTVMIPDIFAASMQDPLALIDMLGASIVAEPVR